MPRAFVSASAIGFYGSDRGAEVLTEDSGRGDGFLADVVSAWEGAMRPAAEAGVRVTQLRTGVVQTPTGGMLRLLAPLFWAGLGGRIGTGEQWLSWIALDDLLDIYLRAMLDDDLHGQRGGSRARDESGVHQHAGQGVAASGPGAGATLGTWPAARRRRRW
jgi:hypothetical protein